MQEIVPDSIRLNSGKNDARGDADGRRTGGDIADYNSVGTDQHVIPHPHPSNHLRSCSDINVPPDDGHTIFIRANRDLLKNQTVGADRRTSVNHHTVGMRREQPAPDSTTQWNVCPGDHAPHPMAQDDKPAIQTMEGMPGPGKPFMRADARQQ